MSNPSQNLSNLDLIISTKCYAMQLYQSVCTLSTGFVAYRFSLLAGYRSVIRTANSAGDQSSIPGPVKSDTASPTARHRCNVSSEL